MLEDGYDARSDTVVNTAFELGRASGKADPVHLLVALSEDNGEAAQLLKPEGVPGGLRAAVFPDFMSVNEAVWVDFRLRQVMGSAHAWAVEADTQVTPEHLLVALAEQADSDVVAACTMAGVDLGAARERALARLGWTDANVPVLSPLDPAGSMDRPPLPLADLPTEIWAELQERQRRMPLSRIHRTWQWYALSHNEARAAWRIVDRDSVNEDERASLLHYHHEAIQRLAAHAIPELSARPTGPRSGLIAIDAHAFRRLRLVPLGWVTWLGNRRVGIRDAWFRLTWRY